MKGCRRVFGVIGKLCLIAAVWIFVAGDVLRAVVAVSPHRLKTRAKIRKVGYLRRSWRLLSARSRLGLLVSHCCDVGVSLMAAQRLARERLCLEFSPCSPSSPSPMQIFARQARSCRVRRSMWAFWIALCTFALPVSAQSGDSPATLGPILIDPISGEQSGEMDGPFITVPRVGPQPTEPSEFGPGEIPPTRPLPNGPTTEFYDPVWDTAVPNSAPARKAKMPPNYWVISSRKCPQAGSPCTADQCTQFYYYGPTGSGGLRNPADFYASLRPDVPVCMMVHGSLIEWEQMLEEGHHTYEWLKAAQPNTPFQMVFMTWPSDRPLTIVAPIDFSILGKRSAFNGLYLARVLSKMPPETSVSMIGHSHGARMVVSALNLVGGGDVYGYRMATRDTPWPRLRAVMAAAALDHHWLDPNERYGHALDNAESLVNLRNRNDFALRLYLLRLPLGAESLGRVGFNSRDQQLLGANYTKVRDVEVSGILGARHIWPWFYSQPGLAKTLTPYLFFQEDVPPTLTLKPDRRRMFGTQPQEIITEVPPQSPRTSDARGATLVRGMTPSRTPPAPQRSTDLRSDADQRNANPSALRMFGAPASRPPRN